MASRDRLAAARQQRQQGQQAQAPQNAYEMQGVQQNGYNGNGAAAADGLAGFQQEIGNVNDMIRQFEGNVARIGELHQRSLSTLDEEGNRRITQELDNLIDQTRGLSADIKSRIETLKKTPKPAQEAQIRVNQVNLISQKFLAALQNYQTVERDYRQKYKARVERQFKIVKPDATQEELNAVLNDDSTAQDQIFQQAIANSNRFGESRAAYHEVQERHADIKKIEQTMAELAQLFNDMSMLINQQDETLDQINQLTEGVQQDAEAGLVQVEKATDSARRARRKRKICFFLTLLLLAIIAIVLAVVITQNKKN